MLSSVLSANSAASLTLMEFMICTGSSLVLGILAAALHLFRNHSSKSFILTLAMMPVIVQAVIMMVNGNLGTGVAVMGAFSLVRFRSVPGNAREISSIFLAMALGLASGMGYIGTAFLLLIFVSVATILLICVPFGEGTGAEKSLKITIPENLDYEGIFDDIFKKYTLKYQLIRVRTANMGSLFELQYEIVVRKESKEKELIDQIRCRNGNLSIVCGRISANREEL